VDVTKPPDANRVPLTLALALALALNAGAGVERWR